MQITGVHTRRARARRARFSALLFVCLFASRTFALDPSHHISQYAHNAWTIQEGYLAGVPEAIAQTTDGYLWIGADGGLVRFDGVRFVPWTAPSAGSYSYSSGEITALLGAPNGSLWIASRASRGALSVLSRWSGQELVHYPLGTISGNYTILETRSGDFWTSSPLCQVIGPRIRCYGSADGMPDLHVYDMAEDKEGSLWLGGDKGLVRLSAGVFTSYLLKTPSAHAGISGVEALAPARDGSIWVVTSARAPGLGLEHFVRGEWVSQVARDFDGANLRVKSLLLDRENALWIGTWDEGLYRIYEGSVDHFDAKDGLSSDLVEKLFEDREGNVWAATSKGIDRFRPKRITSFSKHEGLCTGEVDSVLAAQDGTLWVGGDGALAALHHGALTCWVTNKDLPGDQVTALFEDQAHHLWVGLDDRMTLYEDGRFTPINRPDGTPIGLIASIAEDTDHNIWMVSIGHHRAVYRIKDRKFQEEVSDASIPKPRTVVADPHGGIWLGLMNGDLARYRDRHVETFHIDRPTDTAVLQVSVGADGSVFGATGFGLIGWKNGRQQVMGTRNGLPCDAVGSFITDDAGSLWLYMRCGLITISNAELQRWWQHPDATLQVRVFDALDGMQVGTAPFQGSAKTADGKLWFANEAVLQMVDPAQLSKSALLPLVHVEEITADQKHYQPGVIARLPALTRNLEIDYTAPSFAIPQRVRFRYRLKGHETAWQEAGTRRQAFYSDLSPGNYQFNVVASNEDGVWNETGATQDFSVAAVWYQTAWFRASGIGTFLVLLWAVYQLRVRQIGRAKNLQHEMQTTLAHANRLAAMGQVTASIAHEVNQPITGTVINAQTAQKLLSANPPDLEKINQALARIVRDGNRAAQVAQRVRAMTKQTPATKDIVALNDAIAEVVDMARWQAVKHQISMQTELAPALPTIQGDRIQLQQVVLNLIINAIEAMSATGDGTGELSVRTQAGDAGNVLVIVADSGPGLAPASVTKLFEPFYTTKPDGLGLGLSICRSIVEAHGGQLSARSNVPRGTIFQFSVPAEPYS